jgi:hypothetical protein
MNRFLPPNTLSAAKKRVLSLPRKLQALAFARTA